MRLALVHGSDGADGADAQRVDTQLVDALTARGIACERRRWDDPTVDWSGYDLAVVRSVSGPTLARDALSAWAAATGAVTRVENPPDVLRWNTHRGYLIELEERGAPVVPTAWLGQGDTVDLADLCASRDWDAVVIEPAVTAGPVASVRVGGGRTGHRSAQATLDALLGTGDALVQPLRSRTDDGELSLVAIDGRVTHAVHRRPSPDAVALAEWVLEVLGTPLLCARVDLVTAEDGTLELVGVDAVGPDLYLERSEEGTRALIDAIHARLVATGPSGG